MSIYVETIERVRRKAWGGMGKRGNTLGETEAERAQLVAVAWSGMLHYPRRGLAMVGIGGAEWLNKRDERKKPML